MMFSKKILLALIFYILLIIPSHVSAWDGQRRGLLFGVGMGATINRTTSTTGNTAELRNYTGMNVEVKAGSATSNTFQLYIFDNISVFDKTYMDTVTEFTIFPFTRERVVEKELVHLGAGLGASYYLSEDAPSFFFEGGFGFCYFGDPVFQDTKTGAAYNLAGGYEFSRHWSAKFGFLGATARYDDNLFSSKSSSIFNFIFTINVLGY